MSLKKLAAIAATLVLLTGFAQAQQPTGEIYGKAADKSGAVVPGVTVTLSGPALLQPQTAVTSGTGTYRFPGIAIGTYAVKFTLAGFTTVVHDGINITMGRNAQVNGTLDVSAMQEVVTVTGEAPLIDMRSNTRAANFNQEALQNIPSARDPWVILQQSAGVVMDRENIGGNMSGQQSNYIARGASSSQGKWNLDGVDITDMSATGASPVYYDFDSFEEMQITTGGADVTMQTPGVGVNLVTKSGSDRFKGSARFYVTDQKFQATNVTDQLRKDGASSGNPIQNIKDYGVEMGGPIVKGKAWIWGSYGKQDIKVGVNGFFLKDSEQAGCGKFKGLNAAALSAFPFADVKACLNTDLTSLEAYNFKFNYRLSSKDTFSLFSNIAAKVRNARGADDLHPIDATNRQQGVQDPALGSKWWKTGANKTYKASLRHVFSDKFLMELQYAHVGNNFVLDFHDPALSTVQPSVEIVTGAFDRSFNASQFVRPTNSVDLTGTKSASGFLGADHAIKFGLRYRQDRATSTNHRGGNIEARWQDANGDGIFQSSEASQANIYRDSYTDYNLFDESAYLQDTVTKGRLTAQLGIRFDRQWDRANQSVVPGTPFIGQATRTGLVFDQLPAINFPGATSGVKYTDLVPRIGLNWDANGDGRTVIKASYARYAGQMGDGDLASTLNPVGTTLVRYPWTDLNGDKFVQANEINISAAPLTQTAGYDYRDPKALKTFGRVDPNVSSEKTNEAIIGFNRQFSRTFAIGIAGIYRKYTNFRWNDTDNISDADYSAVSFTANCASVPAAQNPRCPTITYYQPTSKNLSNFTTYQLTNRPGYYRDYKGLELTWSKRAKSLTINGSFTASDTKDHYPQGSYEDPSNISNLDGAQYAPVTSGSGLDNVYINAKWLFRMNAAYTIPWQQIGVAMNFNARSGYPRPSGITSPTRPNGAGQTTILLSPLGDERLPSFNNLDLRLDKTVKIGTAKIVVSADVFNVLNNATVQSFRRIQNASNANLISALVAPRVIRFGARLGW
ncbi:MAG: carboxypeptidase regulatory-like domain-containing protein [Vicinamibacteria bacterium]